MSHQPPAHDREQLRLRHRLGEEIALSDVAADALQLVTFVRGLDPLGHGLESKTPRELHDGLANAGIDAVDMAVGDVATIDLELAEGQLAQTRQRGVASAENHRARACNCTPAGQRPRRWRCEGPG